MEAAWNVYCIRLYRMMVASESEKRNFFYLTFFEAERPSKSRECMSRSFQALGFSLKHFENIKNLVIHFKQSEVFTVQSSTHIKDGVLWKNR